MNTSLKHWPHLLVFPFLPKLFAFYVEVEEIVCGFIEDSHFLRKPELFTFYESVINCHLRPL